jgi:hypothetical protein
MNKLLAGSLWFAALAIPALGAVNKDGGKPAVNPCGDEAQDCAEADAARIPTEPLVIYLDADGEELVRLPLSRFREERPDVKLPPTLETD